MLLRKLIMIYNENFKTYANGSQVNKTAPRQNVHKRNTHELTYMIMPKVVSSQYLLNFILHAFLPPRKESDGNVSNVLQMSNIVQEKIHN